MPLSHRAWRLPLLTALVFGTLPAWSQQAPPAVVPVATPTNSPAEVEGGSSALDGELFYELLLAEMAAAQGDGATAVDLLLDAAHQTQDAILFRRAADLALQSRSGARALQAAQAWHETFPQSREANRYVLQILLALNRVSDTVEPLSRELAATPPAAKAASYLAVAQLYSRVSDKALAAAVVEQALQSDLHHPTNGPAAWAMLGHMRLSAGQTHLAVQAAEKSHALQPHNGAAALLALDLLENGHPQAEPYILGYLDNSPSEGIRLAYARVLAGQYRLEPSRAQLQELILQSPEMADAWMLLATVQLEMGDIEGARRSLSSLEPLAARMPDERARNHLLSQVYVLNGRAALRAKDYEAAWNWLQQVPEEDRTLSIQSLRATALMRQGQLAQGRALLRTYPAQNAEQERQNRRAEVHLLRDAGAHQEAYLLQLALYEQQPLDADVGYETALLAERVGKYDMMERLLREIIARDASHQHALNALGYSLADRGVRLPEARALVEQALALTPGDPFITDSLAWVEFRSGNHARALELLEKAYAVRDDVEIATHLGEVLWTMGKKDQALHIWRQALQRDALNEVLRATLQRLNVHP